MAIGGYTAAILILGEKGFVLAGHDPASVIPDHGMRPLFTIPIAGLVTGVIGYLFGLPALRLAAVSLALATLAVAVSFPALAKRFEHLTGGGGGLSPPTPEGAVRLGHRDSALALLRSMGDGGDPVRRRLAPRSRKGRACVARHP